MFTRNPVKYKCYLDIVLESMNQRQLQHQSTLRHYTGVQDQYMFGYDYDNHGHSLSSILTTDSTSTIRHSLQQDSLSSD